MPDDGSGSGNAANSGGGGGGSGVTTTLFTQEQVNHFNAEAKRTALNGYFKELGFEGVPEADELKATLTKATEFDKLQKGQQSDVERLSGELGEANKKAERAALLETRMRQAEIAAEKKLKPKYWKFIEGKSDEEITASVDDILKDLKPDDDEPESEQQNQERPGTGGRPPEPNPQQGRGGGQPPAKSLAAGAEAYKAKHKRE